MKAILFSVLPALVFLGLGLGKAAEEGQTDPGKYQDTNMLSSSNFPAGKVQHVFSGTNNLPPWTNGFTLWTNRVGGTNAIAFTNAHPWSHPSAWSTNHWWTNFAQFTNAIRTKWTNTSRPVIVFGKPATANAVFPTGSSQPQFLTDFKAAVDKFEQDRQQLLKKMKSASDKH